MIFIVRDQEISVTKASTIYEIWIKLGEVVKVQVEKPGGLEKGTHDLEVTLKLGTTVTYGFEKDGGITYHTKLAMNAI
jgi:hypothetical protein